MSETGLSCWEELEIENGELRVCVEKLGKLNADQWSAIKYAGEVNGQRRARIEALKKALRHYGRHDPNCHETPKRSLPLGCACGLDAALAREVDRE